MYEVVIKKHLYYVIVGLLCIVSFAYKDSLVRRSYTALVSYITYPFLYSYAVIDNTVGNWKAYSRDRAALKSAFEQLEIKNQQLKAELIIAQATALYADSIHELRSFKERYNFTGGIIAQVLSITSTDYEQTIMVNAGFHQGIVKNMVALADNCLIGKVVEVYPWYAKVRLITDARCKVSAVCASTGAVGIHHGLNNSGMTKLEHVTHLDTVKQGDLIISTGKGMVFPQGFALGAVRDISLNGLVYHLTIEPLFTLKTLSYCLLISKELCEKQ